MATSAAPAVLGRKSECRLLDRLLEDVRGGQSAVLVIRGEAGIGKTVLLRYAAAQAAGFRVAQITGVEAEMELPFAGIHQLCAPMLARRDALPKPQRDALSVALGLSSGDGPDRFLIALAVLNLLAEDAAERPLVCLVEDAQWLDAASGQVLGFVARRMLAESVALVVAVREPPENRHFDGLPELALDGLDEGDAGDLLARAVPGRLDDRVRDRIIAETRGNPLALLELPRRMNAAELAGGFELPVAGDVPGHIERHYLRRSGELPEATQQLLLLAAADPVGDATLVWRAAERLGIGTSALTPASQAELLKIGPRVAFRHPLVRSAVYRSAAEQERRAVHLALAEATDRESDPDRRVWHLAAAAAGPDEKVASELERSAGRAQSRGGLAAAAAFLQRAVELTQDPTRRAERGLAAAQASFQAGAFDVARGLLAAAEAGSLDEFHRARVSLLRAQIAFASGLRSDAPPLLLEAGRRLEPFDLALARETYLAAWGASVMAGAEMLPEICRTVRTLPAPGEKPLPLELLLDGLAALISDGYAAATPVLQQATNALPAVPVEDVLRWGWMAIGAPSATWDVEGMREITARNLQLVRDVGALGQLPIFLSSVGIPLLFTGDFAGAAAVIAETETVAAAIGSPIAPYTLIRLQALRGREDQACAAIGRAIEDGATRGQAQAVTWAQWAASLLYNGLGHYDEAASSARQAASGMHPWPRIWALPELVEAAARSGDAELARDALERLAETTQPCGTDWALGIETRCRALLSRGAVADALYREAIERLSRTPLRPELARAHLLYGEWLRREHRRVDARAQLRAAHDQFTAIGMEAFAERARKELQATGEKVRKRSAETRDDLTAQERHIAQLARDGLSNTEIGARLFLSPRTVEWHLRKVFAKLGIGSRLELARVLPPSEVNGTPREAQR